MFKELKCDFCGECLDRCQYLNFEKKGGEAFRRLVRNKESDWIYDCITCAACNEYCPQGARPFDLILQRMDEKEDFTDPGLRAKLAERFLATDEPKPVEQKDKVMSICVMQGNMPWAIQGQLFEGIPLLKGRHYFCNVLFAHMGNESIMRERLSGMVNNLAKSGAKEIVFVHDDCYAMLKDLAPEYGVRLPFRPVHLFEYLRNYLRDSKNRLQKLNMKIAYQRPCASRFTSEKEGLLDEIFELIGVERVSRKYDRVNALCCGLETAGPNMKLFPRGKNYAPFRDKNIKDAKINGAEAMVYLCAMCFTALHKIAQAEGLRNYMISDICRLALGETLPDEKPL